jgi:hypoxanthine phosphoribosyltransferase
VTNQRLLSWADVDKLVEHLVPQFFGHYDALVMITRGGVIPGGLIAEQLGIDTLHTAGVSFPADTHEEVPPLGDPGVPESFARWQAELGLTSMPRFHQFPPDELLRDRRVLVVSHVWNHGRAINAVAGRVQAAGGQPELCVLHYKPTKSLFPQLRPDYYAAVTDEYIIYPWETARRMLPYRPITEWT